MKKDSITFKTEMNLQDYRSFYHIVSRNSRITIGCLLGTLLLIDILLGYGLKFLVMLIVYYFFMEWQIKREFNQRESKEECYRLTQDGIENIPGKGLKVFIKWEDVYKVRQNEKYIIVMKNKTSGFLFKKKEMGIELCKKVEVFMESKLDKKVFDVINKTKFVIGIGFLFFIACLISFFMK
ncbi:MAG: YcxB family protein [Selenomonadaceae bacterium]